MSYLFLVYASIGIVIFMFILILKGVSYISKIKTDVRTIVDGNLTHRVNIKYKNKLGELAENINYMVSELEKEESKRREFISNISHDFRTPLTNILGAITIIKNNKYNSKDELNKYINIVESKAIILRNILENYNTYLELTSKGIYLNYENLELNELGRQILESEESIFNDRLLKLEVALSNEPIYIYGDPDLFARAVNNLIDNSLKYSRPNTVVKIKISKERIDNLYYGVFSTSNVPRENVSNAEVDSFFELLYKKDHSRHEEGCGLGLTIAKEIAKIHRGFIKGFMIKNELVIKLFIEIALD